MLNMTMMMISMKSHFHIFTMQYWIKTRPSRHKAMLAAKPDEKETGRKQSVVVRMESVFCMLMVIYVTVQPSNEPDFAQTALFWAVSVPDTHCTSADQRTNHLLRLPPLQRWGLASVCHSMPMFNRQSVFEMAH